MFYSKNHKSNTFSKLSQRFASLNLKLTFLLNQVFSTTGFKWKALIGISGNDKHCKVAPRHWQRKSVGVALQKD